nr:MAG TPA: homing endonuclease [Caudoviricetes sp.]
MIEIWKQYDEHLEVSDRGNVRSIATKYQYKNHDNGKGYLSVTVQKSKEGVIYYKVSEYIHRLVVKTFIGEIPEGYEVNHIDFDKSNNSLNNLEIVTRKQNMEHNVKHNRINTIKANEDTRQPVVVYDKLYNVRYEFKDIKTASLYFGYNKYRFSHILNRHNGETTRFKISRVKEKRVYE